MRRLVLFTTLVALIAGLAGPSGASTTIDWHNRRAVDIELPNGWQLQACEGDAPFLCFFTPEGNPDGTVLLLDFELTAGTDTSRAAVEADAADLYRMTEEDRQFICGQDYELEGHPVEDFVVAGVPGYRFGFTLRDGAGQPTEHVVLHLAFHAGKRYVVSTPFSDPAGCPGEDPERDELPITAIDEIEPHLGQLVSDSVLPSNFEIFPLCRPDDVPPASFTDTEGNSHEHLIDCLAWFELVDGYSATTFGAADAVTRGQLAAVVARLVARTGEELPHSPENGFSDVGGHRHEQSVNQLAAAGIVRGTTETSFEPDRPVTRAQATALLVRAYEYVLRLEMFDRGAEFIDVSGAHADAIGKAATAHLVFGSDSRFFPDRTLRRDQMAALVGRTLDRVATGRFVLPPDPS